MWPWPFSSHSQKEFGKVAMTPALLLYEDEDEDEAEPCYYGHCRPSGLVPRCALRATNPRPAWPKTMQQCPNYINDKGTLSIWPNIEDDPVQAGNTKERESHETAVSLTSWMRSRRWRALLRHLLHP